MCLLFPLLVLSIWAHQASCALQTVPVVRTTSGKLQGISASNNTNAYLGIPYAVPPVGLLRFQAPRELITPLAPRNATNFSPACIQLPSSKFSPSPTGESEDCLTLNVWASKNNAAALPTRGKPVFVWLYGGAWVVGSSSSGTYNFTNWADAHPEIVFVSVNYRLNLFGYPQTPAITRPETNAGLRDQRLAIEWVYKNIAAFGGDPTRVVLGGQSAGAGSAGGYLYSHPYDSLLSGAILMSGQPQLMSAEPAISFPGIPTEEANSFQTVANAAGCTVQGGNWDSQLRCMKQKSTQDLVNILKSRNIQGITPYIDNQTVFSVADYKTKGQVGKFAKVPVLLGTTDNEADYFLFNRTTGTLNTTLSDLATLALFTCYDSQQASVSVSAGVPTYRYRYMARFPAVFPPPFRVAHAADLPILFSNFNFGLPGVPHPSELEFSASVYMQKAWSAFITKPNGGLEPLGWPKYGGSSGGATLVELFQGNNVENPLLLEDPRKFDARCASFGF
ncbi:alpha/beta-hydrolase [Serendipita vermifera]|nr:alpha/beta-hydrolase [Serendipita vermifera]